MGYKTFTTENKLMVYSSKQQYFFPNIYVPLCLQWYCNIFPYGVPSFHHMYDPLLWYIL